MFRVPSLSWAVLLRVESSGWSIEAISGAFINLKFGQPFHEDACASFFFECGSGYLAHQHDVRNDSLLDGFDRIDKPRQSVNVVVHNGPL